MPLEGIGKNEDFMGEVLMSLMDFGLETPNLRKSQDRSTNTPK